MNTIAKPIKLVQTLKADTSGKLPRTVEICQVGKWQTPWHGDFELTKDDLEDAIRHFNAGVYRVQGTEPLSGSLDHLGGAAAFRIENIYLDGNSLMADVTWTELGKEKLLRDEYRYISFEFNPRGMPFENPEKAGEYLDNVLTGATLTNDPLFKKLKPVMASARTGSDKLRGDSMNLEDLRAKDPSTLGEDEKKFLAEHKQELTDEEREKFELKEEKQDDKSGDDAGDNQNDTNNNDHQDDKSGDDAAGDGKDNLEASAKPVTITAAELAKLKASAQAGLEAKAELDRQQILTKLNAHVATGRIKSSQVDEASGILLAAAPALRERIEKLLASLPENRIITEGEKGSGKSGNTDQSKADQLTASAEQRAAEKKISFGQALRELTDENPELANYREEE